MTRRSGAVAFMVKNPSGHLHAQDGGYPTRAMARRGFLLSNPPDSPPWKHFYAQGYRVVMVKITEIS